MTAQCLPSPTGLKVLLVLLVCFGVSFENKLMLVVGRLNTIMDYDRVVVMRDGQVKEFDTPANLLRISNGLLSNMVDQTGTSNAIHLRAMANKQVAI